MLIINYWRRDKNLAGKMGHNHNLTTLEDHKITILYVEQYELNTYIPKVPTNMTT